jgi:hypothetical protein
MLMAKGLTIYIKCYKQERFYNAELLCGEMEENDFLSKHFNSSLAEGEMVWCYHFLSNLQYVYAAK